MISKSFRASLHASSTKWKQFATGGSKFQTEKFLVIKRRKSPGCGGFLKCGNKLLRNWNLKISARMWPKFISILWMKNVTSFGCCSVQYLLATKFLLKLANNIAWGWKAANKFFCWSFRTVVIKKENIWTKCQTQKSSNLFMFIRSFLPSHLNGNWFRIFNVMQTFRQKV